MTWNSNSNLICAIVSRGISFVLLFLYLISWVSAFIQCKRHLLFHANIHGNRFDVNLWLDHFPFVRVVCSSMLRLHTLCMRLRYWCDDLFTMDKTYSNENHSKTIRATQKIPAFILFEAFLINCEQFSYKLNAFISSQLVTLLQIWCSLFAASMPCAFSGYRVSVCQC